MRRERYNNPLPVVFQDFYSFPYVTKKAPPLGLPARECHFYSSPYATEKSKEEKYWLDWLFLFISVRNGEAGGVLIGWNWVISIHLRT